MNNRRSALGRGLDALIPTRTPPPVAEAAPGAPQGVHEVDIDLISPNPQQPRTVFDEAALDELADSIREHGVIQPLLVSRSEGGTYQLIAGERRLLASRRAGLARVPVVVKEATSRDSLELALVENLQRADLGPLEEAIAFKRLADEFNLTQDDVATRVGRSRPAVANSLRLLSLPADIQASLGRGEITPGHARALLSIEDEARQRIVWQRIVDDDLTVRDAEKLAKQAPQETKAAAEKRILPEIAALQEQLRSSLGTKVDLKKSRKGGQIVIHYYSDEELSSLVGRLAQE